MAIQFGVGTIQADEVLDRLEARIAEVAGLPRDKVFSYAGEPEVLCQNATADQFVTAWFTRLDPDMASVAGGGAAFTVMNSAPRFDVFARLGTDQEFRDSRLLRDRTHGYGQLVYKVAKAFHVWATVPDGGTTAFCEPTRLGQAGITFNPRKPPTGWAWARIAGSAKFQTDYTR